MIWGFVLFQCRPVWSEQATIEWQQQQYRPLFYDFNQDNIPDLLLQAESEAYPSLLITGQIDSVEVRYLTENSVQLPTKIADMDWSAPQAQLLPLQNSAESRSLLVVFPNRKTAQLFAFNGQTIDFRHPIAKYQATDWAFLAQVADHELHVADFDNDGIDEILQLANVGGQHQILKLQPNFNLKSQQTFPENLPWGLSGQARIIIRDFDNNGYADIFALAKAPGSPHYLVLSDQTGQFKNPQGQEISATLGGKPWFDDGSGTVVAQLPEEQRNVLLRFYNNAEVTTSAGSKCVGWIFDPQQNTSWEYCLPVKSAVQPAGAKPQVTGKLQPQAVQSQPVLPFIQSSCPIIDPASTIDVFDPSASGWCPPSGIATPGSAPTLAASSYPVNFRFSAKMQTIYAYSKVYYELWALDEAGVFSMLGMVVIASPESNKPIVSVLAGFANAGNYQLMYRICEDYGCGGFSPSTTVRIYKDTVKHTVSTNVSFGGSIYPVTSSVEQGRSFSFTLTVNSGYNIGSVSGCNGSLSGNTYTTGAISGACTVSASFNLAPVYHTVSTISGSGGTISPASRSVLQGTSTSFTVHPSLGYLIASVSGCGGSLSGNTFTTGAVNGACTVSASFSLAPVYYSVSASAGTGGSISPASRSVVKGGSTSFTVAANSGYSIASVSGCGGSLSGNTFTTGA
ncbi:MAG: hypothetical protein KKB00_03055, partial [Gammaproteobacteria bacterium]|nr:hypothetical protein [Gammaproteobacteria bacterium]